MKTLIYYFSATGNSLSVARTIAVGLPDSRIEPIGRYAAVGEMHPEADVLGFVFPVYYLELPRHVRTFAEKVRARGSSFTFAVATCGEMAGNALHTLKTILERNGATLDAGYRVLMPDNSIILASSKKTKERLLREEKTAAAEIAERITNRERVPVHYKLRYGILHPVLYLFLTHVYREKNKSIDPDRCSSCGLCARLCPVGNIQRVDGRFVFSRDCVHCFACIHWCPESAIRFGSLRRTEKTHYTHPEVTIAQLL